MNRCYSQTNNQAAVAPEFLNVVGNPNIRFVLACRTPNGNQTDGIVRAQANASSYTQENNKAMQTSAGGDDPWPTNRYLNVWITPNLSNVFGTINGYATSPDSYFQSPNTDGVVLVFNAVGVDPANVPVRNAGHTLVHEIGHWLNLIHTYDGGCGGNDFCNDTPRQSGRTDNQTPCANITFPLTANACADTGPNGVMFDNFMDNTNENCGRRMFTNDQRIRMRAVFQTSGPRESFIDNYFKLVSGFRDCIEEFAFIASPICAASGNINWSITGPAFIGNPQEFSIFVNPWQNQNGEAILTGSWNNLTSSLAIPVGRGAENSTFKFNNNSANAPLRNGNFHPAGNNTSGIISFTGATGAGQNWQMVNKTGTASFSAFLNSFSVNVSVNSSITIAVDIPTPCGPRMVQYIFARSGGGGGNFRVALSPNPASNTLTVKGSAQDPTTARSSSFSYDVEILSSASQLVKKVKNISSDQDTDIDISGLVPNQFYTIRFINKEEVVVQKFFKG